MSEYTFELYKPSDADNAIDLFSKCFGKKQPRDDWVWQYHSCPFGQKSIVCRKGDDLAGFYGVILRPLFVNHKESVVGHVMDVMTHPEHQGKGLFTSCAKAAFAASKATGVDLFFGWPNQEALPGHRKVSWRELGKRDIMKHSLQGLLGPENDLTVERVSWDSVSELRDDVDRLFASRKDTLDIVADRRWKWLDWRYALRPGFGYFPVMCLDRKRRSLEGWAVLRKKEFEGESVGHIVDYLTTDDSRATQAIESWALRYFASEGCAYAQFLDNDQMEKASSSWQAEEGRKLELIVRSTDEPGEEMPKSTIDDWYLALGDCDVF